ncbi:MAG: molybdopterin biosynthesis protein, partial [Jannaschia sp.]
MRFGPVPTSQAEGAVLAHATEAAEPVCDGSSVYRIPKGTVLTARHLADLAAHKVGTVIVARLDPGDVAEDAAASRLATALAGQGLDVGAAGTGRVNLRAAHAGIVDLDAAAIDAVNRVDPGITLATVPRWRRMAAGGLVATIKIIPFAVPGPALERACALATDAMRLQ